MTKVVSKAQIRKAKESRRENVDTFLGGIKFNGFDQQFLKVLKVLDS